MNEHTASWLRYKHFDTGEELASGGEAGGQCDGDVIDYRTGTIGNFANSDVAGANALAGAQPARMLPYSRAMQVLASALTAAVFAPLP